MNDIVEKLKALSLGEKLIAGAGVVLLIASFIPWYHVSIDFGPLGSTSLNRNAWQSPGALWSMLAVLIGLALAVEILAARLGNVALPDLGPNLTWTTVNLGAAGVAALLIVIKLINESSSLYIGFFLGIICVAALVAGAYLMYQEATGRRAT